MRFRTTLGNGLVAIGQGNTHFSLQLRDGRLNLHSNLISKFEGIRLGEALNNTQWQKVYVAVNSSHLTLGVNDQLQATQPINPTGENDTVFLNTFLGGIVRDQQILANNAPSFTGCIQDIVVNDMRITEEDFKEGIGRAVEQVETVPGCLREEQCHPNPCQNDGFCTDLWSEYQCTCHRPFLGQSCQYSKCLFHGFFFSPFWRYHIHIEFSVVDYTGATFGYENLTTSMAVVDIDQPKPYESGVDISMFIRTREQSGFIFYFGTDVERTGAGRNASYITGQLSQGNLVVNVYFDSKREKFQVYTVDLSDGYRHFVRVVRMNNSMMVKVNETVSINHEIPSPRSFLAEKLYLGNYPVAGKIPTKAPPAPLSTTPPPAPLTSSTTSAPVAVPAPVGRSNPPFTSTSSSSTVAPNLVDETTSSTPVGDLDFTEEDAMNFVPVSPDRDASTPSGIPLDESTPDVAPLLQPESQSVSLRRNKRDDSGSLTEVGNAVSDPADVIPVQPEQQPQQPQQPQPAAIPQHFKGVIQDVQISDGRNGTRIVELFAFDFEGDVPRPPSIGEVTIFEVMKGVVSDDSCAVDPCQNGGTCMVTWNDYQ